MRPAGSTHACMLSLQLLQTVQVLQLLQTVEVLQLLQTVQVLQLLQTFQVLQFMPSICPSAPACLPSILPLLLNTLLSFVEVLELLACAGPGWSWMGCAASFRERLGCRQHPWMSSMVSLLAATQLSALPG